MIRRSSMLAVFLSFSAIALSAQSLNVAVMDFDLESDNPQFKYLGKGFTELTSVEVARLHGFTLVDRAKRNDILEEQAFALSGAVDESKAMQIGKLLSVDYLVVGSIIDLMGNLVVTYSVVSTESGAVLGKDKTEGQPSEYKRMVREIGLGIAAMMGKQVAVAKAPPPPVAKQAEVLTNFSDAVAALDSKDTKTAEKKLEAAKALDPTDPAVRYYLDKLAGGTSKFAVLPEAYYSLNNPAMLGLIKEDSIYTSIAFGGTFLFEQALPGGQGNFFVLPGSYGQGSIPPPNPNQLQFGESESDIRLRFGYSFPLTDKLGMDVEVVTTQESSTLQRENYNGSNVVQSNPNSVDLNLGWAPASWLLVGLGLLAGDNNEQIGYQGNTGGNPPPSLLFGGEGGFVLRTADGRYSFGLTVGYSNFTTYQYNMYTLGEGPVLVAPWYFDQTDTIGLGALRDFLVLKTIGYIYPGSQDNASYLQVIPAYEHWFGSALSLRIGAVASMEPLPSLTVGYGGTLGATFVLRKWEIDLGATYRQRPSRIDYTDVIPETVFSLGIKRNGVFFGHG